MTPNDRSHEEQPGSGNAEASQASLVEYQAAQASAEHHDGLLWSVTSIVWGASLVLVGFILGNLEKSTLRPLIGLLCGLGAFLTVFVWVSARQFRSLKIQKYDRCKRIEASFDFRQHRDVRYPGRVVWALYTVVSLVFLGVWGAVAWTVWRTTSESI